MRNNEYISALNKAKMDFLSSTGMLEELELSEEEKAETNKIINEVILHGTISMEQIQE